MLLTWLASTHPGYTTHCRLNIEYSDIEGLLLRGSCVDFKHAILMEATLLDSSLTNRCRRGSYLCRCASERNLT
jgi:hypothetical protein